MILKLKALIYLWTGLFLAHKEEIKYVESDDYWKYFKKFSDRFDDMNERAIHGILIGSWQADHGFYSPMSPLRFKKPNIVFNTLAWFHERFIIIKWSVRDLKSAALKILKKRHKVLLLKNDFPKKQPKKAKKGNKQKKARK